MRRPRTSEEKRLQHEALDSLHVGPHPTSKLDVSHHLTFRAGTARAGPMRERFFDQSGGVHVLPESSKGAEATVSIDEAVARHPPDERGERAVEDRADHRI